MASCSFNLFETFRLDPEAPAPRVARHLDRLERSARQLQFPYDREQIERELRTASLALHTVRRCRLELKGDGTSTIQIGELPRSEVGPVGIKLVSRAQAADDIRLRHKTTDRAFYEEPRRSSGAFEVLFVDQDGFLTEGSFTNIFVEAGGLLSTPPQRRGLLPGILRQELIQEGKAIEKDIAASELPSQFYLGNSLRGLIPAVLLPDRP